MKKLLCLLLAVLACVMLATVAAAEEAAQPDAGDIDVSLSSWTCAHCKKLVSWTAMPSSIPAAAGHYHYYLNKNITPAQLQVKDGVTLCLDLQGCGIETNGRAMIAYTGSCVNIMDSSFDGNGYICGTRGDNNSKGGTVTVQERAEFNLYSGTLRFRMDDTGTQKLYQAGVVWVKSNGVMNMYGGTVEGGELMHSGSNAVYGGAICVSANGALNASGGTITSGILPEDGKGPCVYMEAGTARITLSGDANVEEIYAPAGSLGVSGVYTGKARLYLSDTPSAGLDVGTATDATVSGDLFCTNDKGWLVKVSGNDLVLATFTPSGARHYCEHCKSVVDWTALTTSNYTQLKNTAGQYHFYLAANYNGQQIEIKNASVACLDLYGKTLTSNGRALHMDVDTGLNIMDTVGGGAVIGATGNNNPTGGVIVIKAGAVCNLYSGTLKLVPDDTGYGVGTGGVAYMNEAGTMNIYGGTVEGAALVKSSYSLAKNGYGAAFYMNSTAQLNVYGGSVTAGSVPEGGLGTCVYLESKSAQVLLAGSGSVADIYCAYENDQVTVSGTYTGTANITYPDSVALAEAQVMGKASDANVADATLTCGDEWLLSVSGSDLVLTPNAPAVVYNTTGAHIYKNLQDAIDNAGDGYVKLMKSVTGNVTVSGELYLDLNGKTVDGTVTVSKGATLYGMDSQTDDFTVMDVAGYGKLTVAGEGTVAGVPAGSDHAEHGYLKVTEADGVSFHAVNLKITDMTLRAEKAGVYYKSNFGCDEVAAEFIDGFGVALSVSAVPTAENLDSDCVCSRLADLTAGGVDTNVTSTLLKGVMKTTQSDAVNEQNANMTIYGRAYILTADGYMLGAAVQRSFREQVEAADDRWGTLSAAQKASVADMYETYKTVMESWDIPNMIAWLDPSDDGVLKILGIGNSYTMDCMWMLGQVYAAENPGKEIQLGIAYISGGTLKNHVDNYTGDVPTYVYYQLDSASGTWKKTSNATLKQIIADQNWDLVSMQQGSSSSGTVSTYNGDIQTIQKFVEDELGYTPTFFWNMTWAWPTAPLKEGYTVAQQTAMYNNIVSAVKTKIVPDSTFRWIMPVGVAVQNANTVVEDDAELYCDNTHIGAYARIMAAYVWYCQLEGVAAEDLTELKISTTPAAFAKIHGNETAVQVDHSDAQMQIALEAVRNALVTGRAGTFAVTDLTAAK